MISKRTGTKMHLVRTFSYKIREQNSSLHILPAASKLTLKAFFVLTETKGSKRWSCFPTWSLQRRCSVLRKFFGKGVVTHASESQMNFSSNVQRTCRWKTARLLLDLWHPRFSENQPTSVTIQLRCASERGRQGTVLTARSAAAP